jgi:hypothetical protein
VAQTCDEGLKSEGAHLRARERCGTAARADSRCHAEPPVANSVDVPRRRRKRCRRLRTDSCCHEEASVTSSADVPRRRRERCRWLHALFHAAMQRRLWPFGRTCRGDVASAVDGCAR